MDEPNPNITLNISEMQFAAYIGAQRRVINIKLSREKFDGERHHQEGIDQDKGWQYDIEGALGEAALAKYMNQFWLGIGHPKIPDVGHIDCRTTSNPNLGLKIRKKDPADRWFYHVLGREGSYCIVGKLLARDGKKPEYLRDPTGKGREPAYFVPVNKLLPPWPMPERGRLNDPHINA